jgi:transcriptional regulator with XRE-family HTH domain
MMENETDHIDIVIAERLKALRGGRGLTLDELSNRSGVSRAMISRIERGEASPTAQLLSRLCAALDVTLSTFFASERDGKGPLARRTEQLIWRDPETGYERRAVSPPQTASRIDLVEVALPAGARVTYPPETGKAGMSQHVWLFSGVLEITVANVTYRLEPGDCLYMSISEGHVFHNTGDAAAHYAVVLDRGRN